VFSNAYKLASCFTQPVVISIRFFDKTVECGCGAFIILNENGWVVTVAHLFESLFAFNQHAKEISEYNKELKALQEDQGLSVKQKKKKSDRLKRNPKWIMNHSFWWGRDGVQLKDIKLLSEGDLAIGRLDPFDPKTTTTYPAIKNPTTLNLGTSLCKLGYPFHKIEATFNETNNRFELAQGALPLPRFPIEGIYTRNILAGKSKDGKYDLKFLETSSPGLRGQSGGPIFDVNGIIWAVQSRTVNLPLGFSPKIMKNGKEIEENQFLNVGIGIHPEVLVKFLSDNGVKFNLSES